MLRQLTEALVRAGEDAAVRVVILTGTGRAFCAGLNLEAQSKGTDNLSVGSGASPTNIDLRNTPPPVLHAMDKPVIAALNGSAAGYGLDLALGADIRVMAQSAKLAASYAKRGVLPESGGTWYLPRMLGWAKAAELIFTGRTLNAAQSLEIGLVNKVVPQKDLRAEVEQWCAELLEKSPTALALAKQSFNVDSEQRGGVAQFAGTALNLYYQTEEAMEGRNAFVEKRPVNFGKFRK